uniref:RING-type domain-containing protein n=1 Tax=Mesocestoides corti TaxID=53468 RepID=A0A5K3FTN7_MESCO
MSSPDAYMFFDEKEKEQFIKCPYCDEQFSEPVQLPCSHTVCLKCFRESPTCPFCSMPINEKDIEPNKRMEDLIKIGTLLFCESCRLQGITVLNECQHCNLRVCVTCMENHRTMALDRLIALIQDARQKGSSLNQVYEEYQMNQMVPMSTNDKVFNTIESHLRDLETRLNSLFEKIGQQRSEFEKECTQYTTFLSSELRKLDEGEPVAATGKTDPTFPVPEDSPESTFYWLKFHQLEEKCERRINPDFEKIADYIDETTLFKLKNRIFCAEFDMAVHGGFSKHLLCIYCNLKLNKPQCLPCRHAFCEQCTNIISTLRVCPAPFCGRPFKPEDVKADREGNAIVGFVVVKESGNCFECPKKNIRSQACGHCSKQFCAECSKSHNEELSQLLTDGKDRAEKLHRNISDYTKQLAAGDKSNRDLESDLIKLKEHVNLLRTAVQEWFEQAETVITEDLNGKKSNLDRLRQQITEIETMIADRAQDDCVNELSHLDKLTFDKGKTSTNLIRGLQRKRTERTDLKITLKRTELVKKFAELETFTILNDFL